MRVLLVNTSDSAGGAAVAASRLLRALNRNGVEAEMLVRDKRTDNPRILRLPASPLLRLKFVAERGEVFVRNGFSRRHLFAIDPATRGTDITRLPEFRRADVIHLHWINQGMLSTGDVARILRSGKPVVWTMHDMWPFTGICHLPYDCGAYRTACRDCRYLRFPGGNDLSATTFRRKLRMLDGHRVAFVAVSRWQASLARSSALLEGQPVTVIPNALPLEHFVPVARAEARAALSVPDGFVVAFGAARLDDPVKGLGRLFDALRLLAARGGAAGAGLHLLLFGGLKDEGVLREIPVGHTYLGRVDGDRLPLIYSAADAVVSASDYESFGQTLAEAQACGCVPVAFEGSGPSDIIVHRETGYLARHGSAEGLADGLEWAMRERPSASRLREHVARNFSEQAVAARHAALYAECLAENRTRRAAT